MAAGLDLERLYHGEYEAPFLAMVLAWYRGHVQIGIHQADARITEQERQSRRRR